MPPRSRLRTLADLCLAILFLGLLALPALGYLSGIAPPTHETENRPLASLPAWRWTRSVLNEFPGRFEAFFNDHFGYRETLLHGLNRVRVDWLKTSPSDHVVIGKRNWLFYTIEPVGGDYPTARPFTPEELERWRRLLEARRAWLADRGIAYLFVVAPDKQTVYPEKLPPSVRRRRQGPSRLDQLVDYLNAHSDFPILDLREPLRQAKEKERVYARTDSHWNGRGAYVGYRQIVDALAPRFAGMAPWPPAAFEEVARPTPGGDLARMLGLDELLPEFDLSLRPQLPGHVRRMDVGIHLPRHPSWEQPFALERSDTPLPRAVLFHDSFAANMIPFLGEHFQRLFCLFQEPGEFDRALVSREKPDVVIQEIVERKLMLPLPEG